MIRKLKNILWFMPVYFCGGLAGAAMTSLGDLWSPMWWDFAIWYGFVGISLVLTIWWLNILVG